MQYCAFKQCPYYGEVFAVGTKEEIVNKLGKLSFTERREVEYQLKGEIKAKYWMYNDEYNDEEMYKDAIERLFSMLRTDYRFILYRICIP
jgi:hypothetical protein